MANQLSLISGPCHDAGQTITKVGEKVKSAFTNDRTLLSFNEYLDVLWANPRIHARNAAQYIKDVFDHFGFETRGSPAGQVRRFKLFDLDFDGEGWVSGQEEAQNAIYRVLCNFVRLGRINKLIFLHGPNGSAKSSIVGAIMRAMESYSRLPEGALYRFNWLFPTEKMVHGSKLGFHDSARLTPELMSYAHCEGEDLDARMCCELKDHPLFLIPKEERRELLRQHLNNNEMKDFAFSNYLLEGDLCHKCRQIFGALLGAYHGDYLKVLRHIQVERFYIDRRYQHSAVTVEPQLSADAAWRQVTADRSITNLPRALHNLNLLDPYGPLVHANRGMIEYADLLKRPIDAFRYLLGASETAAVPMDPFVLRLDQVLIASSNDKHLNAFKDIPDFASFKGRIELIRVPYLRTYRQEQNIYSQRITSATVGRHVAPHAIEMASMWSVMTRLKKPITDRYHGELKDLVDDLSPLEKLKLYDHAEIPKRLTMQQANNLRNHVLDIYKESDTYPRYEGGAGASAREIKTALFNAAQSPEAKCLSPLTIFEELRTLCKDKTVYEFLQQDVVDGYHHHEDFVRLIEAEYLDKIDEEIRDSMGLISENQYKDLFERYIFNVSHWVKGEKLKNRITGELERPSDTILKEMEAIIMPQEQERGDFRRTLISAIGAYKLDHPQDSVDYVQIFPDLFRRLRDHFYDERKKVLRKNTENVLRFLSEDKKDLTPKEINQIEEMLTAMKKRHGYCEYCAKDAIVFLIRKRYST